MDDVARCAEYALYYQMVFLGIVRLTSVKIGLSVKHVAYSIRSIRR